MARGPNTGRVTKRVSSAASSASESGKSRMSARQMGKLVEQASSSSGGVLQDMVDEAAVGSQGSDGVDAMDGLSFGNTGPVQTVCPITDKNEKPFPLMLLPAEIRNEIYRACLTRPYNILLSRKEPPTPERESEKEGDSIDLTGSDSEDETVEGDGISTSAAYQQNRQGTTPALGFALSTASIQPAGSSTSQPTTGGLRAWASRSTRPIRLLSSRSAASTNNGNNNVTANAGVVFRRATSSRTAHAASRPTIKPEQAREPRPQDEDPLIVNLLRTSKTVYQEARSILYSENLFTLDLETALPTLAALHQRSRRQIKHCELEIPCYNEILERFQETVRLSLRYCWGLKKFVINMPFTLPGADGSGTTGNTTVYANGFDILRWLPRQCEVELRGQVCHEIEAVVSKNAKLAKTLDEVRIAARQHNLYGLLPEERHALEVEAALVRGAVAQASTT